MNPTIAQLVAELERRRETAPDEATARAAADELHTLLDDHEGDTEMIDTIDDDYCESCRRAHQEDDIPLCDEAAVAAELEGLVRGQRLEDDPARRLYLLARAQWMLGRLATFAAADEMAARMAQRPLS